MRRASKLLSMFGALALVVGLVVVPLTAQAITSTMKVDVGANLGAMPAAGGAPADGMRFYAPHLKVAQGDRIQFTLKSFHTATLLPANVDVEAWTEDNAGGHSHEASLLAKDPDDTSLDPGASNQKPSLKANNQAIFATNGETCGTPSTAPCQYLGNSVLSSGTPQGPNQKFTVTMDASVGDTVWVICLVHPHMRLRIDVVDNVNDATTQAQIDAYRADKKQEDAEQANALHHRLLRAHTKHKTASGKTVWDAYAGYDTHTLSLDGMYPKRLVVKKGQWVRWHFPDVYEDHTVTLPKSRALQLESEFFAARCDPDGDDGVGPDNNPNSSGPPCSDMNQFELDLPSRDAYSRGNNVFGKKGDYENSGIRGASVATTNQSYDVKFARRSTNKGFKYMCMIHGGFMSGTVVVKP
jgi:plastocyanin